MDYLTMFIRGLAFLIVAVIVVSPIVFIVWLRKVKKIKKLIPDNMKGGSYKDASKIKKESRGGGGRGGREQGELINIRGNSDADMEADIWREGLPNDSITKPNQSNSKPSWPEFK